MRNGIKKTLFLIMLTLCMLLILGMNQVVNADEVTKVKEWDVSADDNKSKVTATLYSDGSFVISGTGDMKSFSKTCEYDDYRKDIKTIEIKNGVTSIGYGAFEDCKSLTKLYIPKTIIQMGKDIVDGDNDINVYVTSNSYAKTYVEENKIKYQIDDIAPTVNVERLQKGRISEFEVKAEDKDSGLATYAYSTDGVTYVKDNKITIPADKEKITVYVIDKVGNVEETTIEKYKEIEENGLGDVNDDGKIDDKDVDMIKQYTSKSIELTEDQKVRADVNKDGTVDEVDEEELTKYIQLQKPEDDNTTGKDDNTIGKNDNTTGGTEDSKNQNNGEETKNPQSNSGNVKKYSSTTNVNSAKSLPYAGATPIILIGVIICSIIGVIGFVGYRKYRKIK